jgi:ABC-type antimicrobial peptide transport system permease subunit
MKRSLIPYYVSRGLLSALFGYLISSTLGFAAGAVMAILMFLAFVWYVQSGRYLVDTSSPLFPLRRDPRGNAIRDRSVVVSVALAGLTYAALAVASHWLSLPFAVGWLAIVVGVIAYFAVSNWLFVRH